MNLFGGKSQPWEENAMRLSATGIAVGLLGLVSSSGLHRAKATAIIADSAETAEWVPGDRFWFSALRPAAPGLPTVHIMTTSGAVGDVIVDLQTAGHARPPFGQASAIINGAVVMDFSNPSMNLAVAVTATVSPNEGEAFIVSAGLDLSSLGSPVSGSQEAFADLQFGPADPNDQSLFAIGSPLFHFHQEITDGTLAGRIPESEFDFTLLPGEMLDLRTAVTVGGLVAVPEPSTLLLLGSGWLGLAYLAFRQTRRF